MNANNDGVQTAAANGGDVQKKAAFVKSCIPQLPSRKNAAAKRKQREAKLVRVLAGSADFEHQLMKAREEHSK